MTYEEALKNKKNILPIQTEQSMRRRFISFLKFVRKQMHSYNLF